MIKIYDQNLYSKNFKMVNLLSNSLLCLLLSSYLMLTVTHNEIIYFRRLMVIALSSLKTEFCQVEIL